MNKFNKRSNLNKSFKPDEKLLFSKVLDQAFVCTRDYTNKFTEFININMCESLIELIKDNYDVNVSLFGGIDGCERIKIGLSQTYTYISQDEFPISAIEIKYNKFNKNISHRDILGSILGIGIDRSRLGDILVFDTRAVAFVDSDVSSFICNNLESVGRATIKTSIANIEDLYMPIKQYEDIKIRVSSTRLCSIISNTFNFSRSKSTDLIKGKKVLINWERVVNSSHVLKERDTITVRGYGRIYINKFLGKTSKDMIILNVHKYG